MAYIVSLKGLWPRTPDGQDPVMTWVVPKIRVHFDTPEYQVP